MTQGRLFTGKKGFENGKLSLVAVAMEMKYSATVDFKKSKVWKQARLEKQINNEIAVTFYIKGATDKPGETIPFTVRKPVAPDEIFTYGLGKYPNNDEEHVLFVNDSAGNEVFRITEGQTFAACTEELIKAAQKAKARKKRSKKHNA